jgi:hypothetical protein
MARQRQDYLDALNWVSRLMARVPGGHLGFPTPCEGFDVRSLLGHLIGTAHRGLATARCVPSRGIPHVVTDVPDTELARTYAQLAVVIEEAWLPPAAADEGIAVRGPCTALEAHEASPSRRSRTAGTSPSPPVSPMRLRTA